MKRLLAIVILAVAATVVPVQTALADNHLTTVGDEPVLIGPEFCADVDGSGNVDIRDVGLVVAGFGTVYYITDIGQVAADFGRVGYCL